MIESSFVNDFLIIILILVFNLVKKKILNIFKPPQKYFLTVK